MKDKIKKMKKIYRKNIASPYNRHKKSVSNLIIIKKVKSM